MVRSVEMYINSPNSIDSGSILIIEVIKRLVRCGNDVIQTVAILKRRKYENGSRPAGVLINCVQNSS